MIRFIDLKKYSCYKFKKPTLYLYSSLLSIMQYVLVAYCNHSLHFAVFLRDACVRVRVCARLHAHNNYDYSYARACALILGPASIIEPYPRVL